MTVAIRRGDKVQMMCTLTAVSKCCHLFIKPAGKPPGFFASVFSALLNLQQCQIVGDHCARIEVMLVGKYLWHRHGRMAEDKHICTGYLLAEPLLRCFNTLPAPDYNFLINGFVKGVMTGRIIGVTDNDRLMSRLHLDH